MEMAELRSIDLSVEETARLFHVQPQTIARRVRAGELRTVKSIGPAGPKVRLAPVHDWIRVEDASSLLSVSPATVRSNITRGRLAGRRGDNGRWRVLLRSVLEDHRCDPVAVELFGGEQGTYESQSSTAQVRRPQTLHRQLNIRLTEEEAELLERGRDRHGTIRAAVVFGLQAIDRDDLDVDHAALRADRDVFESQLATARAAHRGLRDRVDGRTVDELYCHVCERMVPIEETGQHELDDGTVELFHEKHGHRSGTRFRSNTVIARRAKLELAPVE